MSGRFKLHTPEKTHTMSLRLPDDLYELIRHEVEYERSTIQSLVTQVLQEGITQRQESRLKRLKAEKARLAELRELEYAGAGG